MATTGLMTAEDLARITDDDCRYDLIRGELIRMAPAGGRHGNLAANIVGPLWAHVAQEQIGNVYIAETGFLLARDPDVVLAPDAAFVRSDRLPPEEEQDGFLPLAPDLAVEVVSPSDSSDYVTDKVMEYLDAGTSLVWVVQPRRRIVTVYTPDHIGRVLGEADELDGGDVLPGFRLPVTAIFG